LKESTNLNTNS